MPLMAKKSFRLGYRAAPVKAAARALRLASHPAAVASVEAASVGVDVVEVASAVVVTDPLIACK